MPGHPATAPRRVATIDVVDGWGLGDMQTKLCLTSPESKRVCKAIAFAKGVTSETRRFRLRARGRWRADLQVGDSHVRDTITVGGRGTTPRKRLPTLLATGDSTMFGIESFLSDELGSEATVVGDVRPGLSLSGPRDWAWVADSQVSKLRPDTTVLSIGANEGLPMATADGSTRTCCDAGWLAEYTSRMRATMLTYARDGLGRVFVLTIPAPRDHRRASIAATVNGAIVRAGEGLAGVRALRMDLLFSPRDTARRSATTARTSTCARPTASI